MSDLLDRYALFTDEELMESQKSLMTALLTGATQVTFLGQTVIYTNDASKRKTIDEVTSVLKERKLITASSTGKRTKRIRIQTDNAGF